MKKMIAFVLVAAALTMPVGASDLFVGQSRISTEISTTIINGVEMMPLRDVAEYAGMSVEWRTSDNAAVCTGNGLEVVVPIGSLTAYVNGVEKEMDIPAQLIGGKTMVPSRFLSEELDCTAHWSADNDSTNADPTAAIRISPAEEHYIFELSEYVSREHVYYRNRFGIEMAADLYIAKNADRSQKYPAIVVGPPFGGVKEQGPGVYANQLAQRGFVVLAFDPAYHGYSGGQPRYTASSALYAEDFCASVDYLGTLPFVDREKIGAIGICGSGGFALSAAAMDTRIKAVATSVMYDIAGNMNAVEGEARTGMIGMMSQQRWEDLGAVMLQYPEQPTETVPEGLTGDNAEFYTFYGTPRGHHPNALTNVTMPSMADIMNFPGTEHINEISVPILFVAGENAHSRGYSEAAYERASDPKELYIVQDAIHIDLYDDINKIPFDKFEEFFKANLK